MWLRDDSTNLMLRYVKFQRKIIRKGVELSAFDEFR